MLPQVVTVTVMDVRMHISLAPAHSYRNTQHAAHNTLQHQEVRMGGKAVGSAGLGTSRKLRSAPQGTEAVRKLCCVSLWPAS